MENQKEHRTKRSNQYKREEKWAQNIMADIISFHINLLSIIYTKIDPKHIDWHIIYVWAT